MLKDIASLIGVCAWPGVALFFVVFYRSELRQILKSFGELLPRLKKGHLKVAGQEIEAELSELQEQAVTGAAEISSLPEPQETQGEAQDLGALPDPGKGRREFLMGDASQVITRAIVDQSQTSPKLGLILLSSEIDRVIQEILANYGLLEGRRFYPVPQAIELLQERGLLPSHATGSLRLFWDVRNRLVHGGFDDEDTIVRAIDSGLIILRALHAVPYEKSYVRYANVPLFDDPECLVPARYGTGVLLSIVSPGGLSERTSVHPTLREDYEAGQQVAYRWNLKNVWGKTWYRNPEGGSIHAAWDSSAEFIGEVIGKRPM